MEWACGYWAGAERFWEGEVSDNMDERIQMMRVYGAVFVGDATEVEEFCAGQMLQVDW
jgi:hypothetical protein